MKWFFKAEVKGAVIKARKKHPMAQLGHCGTRIGAAREFRLD
jgi:hypothetical protein